MNDRSPLSDILEGVIDRHAVVLHEVCDAKRRGSRHSGSAVDNHLAALAMDRVDLVSHQVEVDVQLGSWKR